VHYLEILRRLIPRSTRRNHASASYGRSNLNVVAISTLKYLATPEQGRARRVRRDCAQQPFHPCSIQRYQTSPDRRTTSWKALRNKLELITWRLSFEHAGYPVPILKTYSHQYFAPSGSWTTIRQSSRYQFVTVISGCAFHEFAGRYAKGHVFIC